MASNHQDDFMSFEFRLPYERLECVAGVLEVGALDVADGVLGLVPDVLDGILVGAVGRQVDELDPPEVLDLLQLQVQLLGVVI